MLDNLSGINIHEDPLASKGLIRVCRWSSDLGGLEEVGTIDIHSNTVKGSIHLGKEYYMHKDDIEELKKQTDNLPKKKVPTLDETRNPFQIRHGVFGWWDPLNKKIRR